MSSVAVDVRVVLTEAFSLMSLSVNVITLDVAQLLRERLVVSNTDTPNNNLKVKKGIERKGTNDMFTELKLIRSHPFHGTFSNT